jgi:hypothetical protein
MLDPWATRDRCALGHNRFAVPLVTCIAQRQQGTSEHHVDEQMPQLRLQDFRQFSWLPLLRLHAPDESPESNGLAENRNGSGTAMRNSARRTRVSRDACWKHALIAARSAHTGPQAISQNR